MPYQPDYAVPHTTIRAAELNAQFAAIKAQLDAQAAQITALQADNQSLTQQLAARPTAQQVLDLIAAQAARNVDSVAALPPTWSENPPDRAEFNETRDKVNEVLSGLKHPA